jgi:hypothetical protein
MTYARVFTRGEGRGERRAEHITWHDCNERLEQSSHKLIDPRISVDEAVKFVLMAEGAVTESLPLSRRLLRPYLGAVAMQWLPSEPRRVERQSGGHLAVVVSSRRQGSRNWATRRLCTQGASHIYRRVPLGIHHLLACPSHSAKMKSAGTVLKQELVRTRRRVWRLLTAISDRAKARLERDMVVSALLPLYVHCLGPC